MKKILVYLEAQNGAIKRASSEALSAAAKIADGGDIVGVMPYGDEEAAKSAAEYGLKKVYLANPIETISTMAAASAVAQIAKKEDADVVLFDANPYGAEIAPRTAVKLNASYVADIVDLSLDGGELIALKPVYAGKALIKVKTKKDVKIFSLRPNVFAAEKTDAPADITVEKFDVELGEADLKARLVEVVKNEEKLDVLEADIIVSGGRGLKAPENFKILEELADVLGAAVGASRAAVDAGWRPQSDQVGQTGKTVSPTLYIACGISGAIQHLAGMSSSKYIVAINKDKDAPIFGVCDYGIVGDLFDVVPKLTEKLKAVVGK